MKKIELSKKVLTAAITSALAAGSIGMAIPAAPVFAAGTGSVTVTKAVNAKYKAYKLFDGDFTSDQSNKMGNAKANTAYRATVITTIQKYSTSFKPSGSTETQDAQIADEIAKLKDSNPKFANDLAQALDSATPTKTATATNETFTLNDLDQGYWLIMSDATDATYGSSGNSMTTAILIPVNGTKEVKAKSSTPTLTKEVKSTNGQWDKDYHHIADAGLLDGKTDGLTYRLTGTLASNAADYDTYKYAFTDELPKGLDVTKDELDKNWNVSIKATSDKVTTAKDVSAAFTSSVTAATADKGAIIKWSANDVLATLKAAGITGNDINTAHIVVEYTPVYDATDIDNMYGATSTLSKPDVNTAKVTFSNNPYAGGSGSTSDTPEDQDKVYDYNLVIHKIGEDKQPVTGAKFTLTDSTGKTVGKDITVGDNGTFTFTGLNADVEYTLTETKIPTGYKHIDPIKFTINSTKDANNTAVTGITATENADPSNAATLTPNDATITATVTNIEGADMPLTGRDGIIFSVVVGGLLVTASVVMRKQKNAQ